MGESSVRRCIKELRALGLLIVASTVEGGHTRNAYRPNFHRIVCRPDGISWVVWLREESERWRLSTRQPEESKRAFAERTVRNSGIMPADWVLR
jgi:hypothetical protein